MKKMILILISLILVIPIYAEKKDKKELPDEVRDKAKIIAEKKKPPSRTFVSENGKYIVTVEYKDWKSVYTGEGVVTYIARNKKGEILSRFISDVVPIRCIVVNNGNIISFGGNYVDKVFYNKICFYNINGDLLKAHNIKITILGAAKISKNNKYFVLAYQYLGQKHLSLFDINSGKKLWDIPLEFRPHEVGISNNGQWIVVVGMREVVLFDNMSRKYFEEKIKGKGILLLEYINTDGTEFEIKERVSKLIGLKENREGIYERYISRRFIYENNKGKVRLKKVIKCKKGTRSKEK